MGAVAVAIDVGLGWKERVDNLNIVVRSVGACGICCDELLDAKRVCEGTGAVRAKRSI